VAYRMLGSLGEAEDVVQEAWLRWDRTDQDAIEDARAFLALMAILAPVVTLYTDSGGRVRAAATNRRRHLVGALLPLRLRRRTANGPAWWMGPT